MGRKVRRMGHKKTNQHQVRPGQSPFEKLVKASRKEQKREEKARKGKQNENSPESPTFRGAWFILGEKSARLHAGD